MARADTPIEPARPDAGARPDARVAADARADADARAIPGTTPPTQPAAAGAVRLR